MVRHAMVLLALSAFHIGCEAASHEATTRAGLVDDSGAACVPVQQWRATGGSGYVFPLIPEGVDALAPLPNGRIAFGAEQLFTGVYGTIEIPSPYGSAGVLGVLDRDGAYAWVRDLSIGKLATTSAGELYVGGNSGTTPIEIDDVTIALAPDENPAIDVVGDAWVAKLDSAGVAQWGMSFGTSEISDELSQVLTKPDDSVVVITRALPEQRTTVTHIDAAGVVLAQTEITGLATPIGAMHPSGEVVIAGTMIGNLALADGSSLPATHRAVILGVTPGLDPNWAWSSAGWDFVPWDLHADADGVTLAGWFHATVTTTVGVLVPKGNDAIAVRVGQDGGVRWVAAWGGAGDDRATGVARGPGGSWVVNGHHAGALDVDGVHIADEGRYDGLLTWIADDGEILEVTPYAHGSGNMSADAITTTTDGTVVTGGSFQRENDFNEDHDRGGSMFIAYGCSPPIEGFAVSSDSRVVDRVGAGDAATAADGYPDGSFDVVVHGPVASLSLVHVDSFGNVASPSHYDTVIGDTPIPHGIDTYWGDGRDTWILGVGDRETGAMLNAADGSLTLGDGVHALQLFGEDVSMHGMGVHWLLVVQRPDGRVDTAHVFDATAVVLDRMGLAPDDHIADVVAPGDNGNDLDGDCDVAFDLSLVGHARAMTVFSTDADGNPAGGQQWDTYVGQTPIPAAMRSEFPLGEWTWALGVVDTATGERLNADGVLGDDGLWTRRTWRLYGAGADQVGPGGSYRAAAELDDGSLVLGPVFTIPDDARTSCE